MLLVMLMMVVMVVMPMMLVMMMVLVEMEVNTHPMLGTCGTLSWQLVEINLRLIVMWR